MVLSPRASTPEDEEAIARFLAEAFALPSEALSISRDFQKWKFWDPYPLAIGPRSQILLHGAKIVAHAGGWPVPMGTVRGDFAGLHLIDWAADRAFPGAGVRVLRQLQAGTAAVFSIGGSQDTRLIRRALKFQACNTITILQRPLKPFHPALRDSPRDWKRPARVARNLSDYFSGKTRLGKEWKISPTVPAGIPDSLLPKPAATQAISLRSASLLDRLLACPLLSKARCYLLQRAGVPVAYFSLAVAGKRARLLDYGPAELEDATGETIGIAATAIARSEFPSAVSLIGASTEASIVRGFHSAGFRSTKQEQIHALKLDKALDGVERFRMTLADWDAACL